MKPLRAICALLLSANVNVRLQTLFKTAVLLIVGTTTVLSAPSISQHDYFVAISLSDESGTPHHGQYRAGDNVWLKIAITNLSTETIDVPKGEDYTRPRVMKDGYLIQYKKDVSQRIRKNNNIDKGVWKLKPHKPEFEILDLAYWYDLQPGSYQVSVERRFLKQQSTQSNSIVFDVLPALPNSSSDAIVISPAMPPYPAIAAARAVSGTVLVDVQIDSRGIVTSATVASGPTLLRKPASDAAKRWRFNAVEPSAGSRSARLTFIFHELSSEWKEDEPVFSPPYQMSIRRTAMTVVKNGKEPKTPESLLRRTVSVSSRQDGNMVFVKTWKTGNARIVGQTLSVSLSDELREHEIDVPDETKQRQFRLQLRRMNVSTIRRPSIECWGVGLREVSKDRTTGVNILGPNLLSKEGPGAGDNFPKEDWASVLCPIEKPQKVRDGALYGIEVERGFLVEHFLLGIRVTDFIYDEAETNIRKMNLEITFKSPEIARSSPATQNCDFSGYKRLKEPHSLLNAIVKRSEPKYSALATSAGARGTVIVRILVNKRGDVVAACVVQGHPSLRAASLAAAKQWKFRKNFGLSSSRLEEQYAETDLTFRFDVPDKQARSK